MTPDDVKNIRSTYTAGEMKIVALAKEYKVGTRRIVNIIEGNNEVGGYINRCAPTGYEIKTPTSNLGLDELERDCFEQMNNLRVQKENRMKRLKKDVLE